MVVVVGGQWLRPKSLIRLFGLWGIGDRTSPHPFSPLASCPPEITHLELMSSGPGRGVGELGAGFVGRLGPDPPLPTHII